MPATAFACLPHIHDDQVVTVVIVHTFSLSSSSFFALALALPSPFLLTLHMYIFLAPFLLLYFCLVLMPCTCYLPIKLLNLTPAVHT